MLGDQGNPAVSLCLQREILGIACPLWPRCHGGGRTTPRTGQTARGRDRRDGPEPDSCTAANNPVLQRYFPLFVAAVASVKLTAASATSVFYFPPPTICIWV